MIEAIRRDSRVFVAGHTGLVGSALVRELKREGFTDICTVGRADLDLTDQASVEAYFLRERPDVVFLAAAKVGGIFANSRYPAEFMRDNLAIQCHCIHSAWKAGVRKLVFLGSSCIYPRDAEQPISEESLLTGSLESTNQWYAVAKIAGIKMCQAYRLQYGFDAISIMPTNLYGPMDNFHPENSHVVPGLIRRFHEAKTEGDPRVVVWGTGRPLRELMHVDDLARAAVFLMDNYSSERIINVGSGVEVCIADLARLVAGVVGFKGDIEFDDERPDGTPRKRLDSSALEALGWRPAIPLERGLIETYRWFQANASRPLQVQGTP